MTEFILIIALLAGICGFAYYWQDSYQRACLGGSTPKSASDNAEPDTLGLMRNALERIGCQPTTNPDGSISVAYQGENFHMEFGGRYASVWDPYWSGVKADDPDMPNIREAVNSANFNFGPTIVMTAPDENGVVGLHSRRDIMLHPVCPDNVQYVQAVLDSFFAAKEQVREKFQQISAAQTQATQNRRPVGFNTQDKD